MKFLELLNEDVTKINSPEFHALLTPAVKKLNEIFTKEGFEIRIVGGAVRDLVAGKLPKDIDLATNATPEQMIEIAKKYKLHYIPTGLQHGTITFHMDNEDYELTTLRIDKETDGRHATVAWEHEDGSKISWEDDAERRDLTFNAMSLDLNGNLYDYFNGISDLKNGLVKFVGNADARIKEDYLRILRYYRFLGRISNPHIDEQTENTIKQNAAGLKSISGERIWMEISKILVGNHLSLILKSMEDTDVAKYIGFPNSSFNSNSISYAEKIQKYTSNPITILSIFCDHPNVVRSITAHWKLSNPESNLLNFLVMNYASAGNNDIYDYYNRIISGIPKESVIELAYRQDKPKFAKNIQNWTIPKFPITGQTLMSLGIKPGVEMGTILKNLKQKWIDSKFSLTQDELLKMIKKSD